MATLEEITERIKQGVGDGTELGGKTLKLDFKDEGVILVDGASVTNQDAPADCTLAISKDNFEKLATGKLDPATAMFTGKLKIKGDMGVAMKLQTLFRSRG